MIAIRRDQGRLGEIETLLAQGAAQEPNAVPWQVAWPLAGVHAGEVAPARALLDDLCRAGLDRLPENLNHPELLAMLAELSFELEHRGLAEQLAPRLAPFRAEDVFFGLGFCHWGSAAHYEGRVALVRGELDQAVALLEAGVRADQAFGAPIPAARGQAVLATALERRGHAKDREAPRAPVRWGTRRTSR